MPNADTTPAAAVAYRSSCAALSGEERVAIAVEMAEEAKAVAFAGIRFRHPKCSDSEVLAQWIRLLHGEEFTGWRR